HRLQQMEDALSVQRKLFAFYWRLHGEFADVRACHKRFVAGTGQNQNAYARIVAGIEQGVMQLFDGFPIQRVQYLWPMEGDVRNSVLELHHALQLFDGFPIQRVQYLWPMEGD